MPTTTTNQGRDKGPVDKGEGPLLASPFFPHGDLEALTSANNKATATFVKYARAEIERYCALVGSAAGGSGSGGAGVSPSSLLRSTTRRHDPTTTSNSLQLRLPIQWLGNHTFDLVVSYQPREGGSGTAVLSTTTKASDTPKVNVYTNSTLPLSQLSPQVAAKYALLATPDGTTPFLQPPTSLRLVLKGSDGTSLLEASLVDELLLLISSYGGSTPATTTAGDGVETASSRQSSTTSTTPQAAASSTSSSRLHALFQGVMRAVADCDVDTAVTALSSLISSIARGAFMMAFTLQREYLWCLQHGAGIYRTAASNIGNSHIPMGAMMTAVRAELGNLPNAGYTFGYASGADAGVMRARLMRLSVIITNLNKVSTTYDDNTTTASLHTPALFPKVQGELLLDLTSFMSTLEDGGQYRLYPSLTSLSLAPSSGSGSTTTTLLFPVTASSPSTTIRVEDGGRIARHIEAFLCLYDEVSLMVQSTSNILFAPPAPLPAPLPTVTATLQPTSSTAEPQPPLPVVDGGAAEPTITDASPTTTTDSDTTANTQAPVASADPVATEEDDTVVVDAVECKSEDCDFPILTDTAPPTTKTIKEEQVVAPPTGRFFGGVCDSRRSLPFKVGVDISMGVTLKQHASGRVIVQGMAFRHGYFVNPSSEVQSDEATGRVARLSQELQAIVRGSVEPLAFTVMDVARYQRLDANDAWLWAKSSEEMIPDAAVNANIGIAVAPPMPLSCVLLPAAPLLGQTVMRNNNNTNGGYNPSPPSAGFTSQPLSPRNTGIATATILSANQSPISSPGRGPVVAAQGPTSANISEVTVSSQLCGMEIASKTPLAWPLHTGLITPFTASEPHNTSNTTASEDLLDLFTVPASVPNAPGECSMLHPYITDGLLPALSRNLLGEATTFLLLVKTLSQRCPTYFSNLVRFNTKLRDDVAEHEVVKMGEEIVGGVFTAQCPSHITRCRVASFLCDISLPSGVEPTLVTIYYYGSTVMKTIRGGYYALPVTVQLSSTRLTIRGEGAVRPVRTSCHPLPIPQTVLEALQNTSGSAHNLSPSELSDIIIGGVEHKISAFMEVCRGCSEVQTSSSVKKPSATMPMGTA